MQILQQHRQWAIAYASIIIPLACYWAFFAPPRDFPSGGVIVISRGTSASHVAEQLSDARIVRHSSLLSFVLRVSGASSHIQAGAYRFATPQNLLTVAYRIGTGVYGIPPVRLTLPEGVTVREAAAQIAAVLPEVSADDFASAAKPYEGYLFPDTYRLVPSADAFSIVALMRENFNTKIATISADVEASKLPLSDIVTMASLLEREARTTESRRIIAGVLYNRLKLGMKLQVDAVFGYIFSKDTYSPSYADLAVDSPYNTYLHTGLPPGPICNPGLDALLAALHPAKTDYLYYLTGKDGKMRYATTYAGHQANQRKYLQ